MELAFNFCENYFYKEAFIPSVNEAWENRLHMVSSTFGSEFICRASPKTLSIINNNNKNNNVYYLHVLSAYYRSVSVLSPLHLLINY